MCLILNYSENVVDFCLSLRQCRGSGGCGFDDRQRLWLGGDEGREGRKRDERRKDGRQRESGRLKLDFGHSRVVNHLAQTMVILVHPLAQLDIIIVQIKI